MKTVDSHPVVVTERLAECRDFYRRWFGFEAYCGDGAFQVEDATAEYERLGEEGAEFELELTDEARSQRRFGMTDPAGKWVDVIEQIEPAAGRRDPCMVASS